MYPFDTIERASKALRANYGNELSHLDFTGLNIDYILTIFLEFVERKQHTTVIQTNNPVM